MSKGTKKILRDSSRSLTKSHSTSSFLDRNYYNPHVRSKQKAEISILNENKRPATKRDSSATKATKHLIRDMSGGKISFINSTTNGYFSQRGRKSNGDKLFSPSICDKSRFMSPRDRDTTYYMLHQQAINQQKKHQIMVYDAQKQAKQVANKGVEKNINDKSDSYLVK